MFTGVSTRVEPGHLAHLSITPAKRERAHLFAQFAADAEGQALLQVTRTLGRLPLPSEFEHYPALQLRFGSQTRIERLVNGLLTPQSLAETKELKKNDILTYFAMLFLRGGARRAFVCCRLKPRPISNCSGRPTSAQWRKAVSSSSVSPNPM